MKRINYSSDSKWEPIIGYSRAVKIDNLVFVSGTTATNEKGELVGIGDSYAQTKQILANIGKALKAVGADYKDVVRTTIYCTKIDDWEKIGRAHGEVFGQIRPAAAMVEVARLIGGDILVEIEADAILPAKAAKAKTKAKASAKKKTK